ncbi:MAG: hypothetical protein M3Q08_16815 [Pseudomonadota bacterium]|nr:hypothetical protein [Pseudomonadota bacterium]
MSVWSVRSLLTLMRRLATGGSQHNVTRGTSGNGKTAPVAANVLPDPIMAYTVYMTDPRLLLTDTAGAQVERQWWLIAPLGTNVQQNDRLASVAQPASRFQVLELTTEQPGYLLGQLSPL